MTRTWLGLDIGTSATKAVLVDDSGADLAEAQASYAVSRPRPGFVEQEPEAWWRAVCTCVAALRARSDRAFAGLAGIGMSGQMHSAVLLGADDEPLRDAILWCDGRSAREARALHQDHPGLSGEVGVMPMPGFTAPMLAWLRDNEPGTFQSMRRVLLAKDFVRLRLTGEAITDCSDAAGTWLLDEARRTWSSRAIDAVGLTAEQLPALVEGSQPAGRLRDVLADEWGMPRGLVVAGGGGDAAAGGIGIGAIAEGSAFLSLGTSGQVFAPMRTYRAEVDTLVHSFCHALPDVWFAMGCMLTGASALDWFARFVGQDISELDAAVAQRDARGGPLFLPYLAGERTPHNNPEARSVFFGLDAETDATAMGRAVMEGVAFAAADCRDAVAKAGVAIEALDLIGGGARSTAWPQILADAMGCPIRVLRGSDKGPAYGAASLARLAATGETPAEVCRRPLLAREVMPRPDRIDSAAVRLAQFRRLFAAVEPCFAPVNEDLGDSGQKTRLLAPMSSSIFGDR